MLKSKILLSLAVLFVSSVSSAELDENCDSLARSSTDMDGSMTMVLRSNACHFWNWSKSNAATYFSADLLKVEAVITGDPHHENFSHVFANGKRVYALNDIDDTGDGPVFLDLVKFLSVSRSVNGDEEELSTEKILEAYIKGLKERNKDYQEVAAESLPAFLEKDFAVTETSYAADYLAKIKKGTKNGKFLPKDGMTRWKKMDGTQQDFFIQLEDSLFMDYIPSGYLIKDRANSVKLKGGSANLIRYLYYLKKSETERHILEFKPIATTSLETYNSEQKIPYERGLDALENYWPKGSTTYQVLGNSEQAFYLRAKSKKYVSFKISDFTKDPVAFAELSYFISYHLGQKHGLQLKNCDQFIAQLEQSKPQLVEKSQKLVTAYLKLVKEEYEARFDISIE